MDITKTDSGATVFTGSGVAVYQALAVKQGLVACKIGMRLNSAYTPTNLMAMVHKITGNKHKRGDYDGAIASVEEWIQQQRDRSHVEWHFQHAFYGCLVEHLPEDDVMLTLPEEGGCIKYRRVYTDEDDAPWRSYETTIGNSFDIISGPEKELQR